MKTSIEFALRVFRELQKTPEASGQEEKTAQILLKHVELLHPEFIATNVGGHGIIALWNMQGKIAKPILLRSDMDAVYVPERQEYAHRCGHDGHMASMLGTAHALLVEGFSYPFGIIFQPAEETGKGAQQVMASTSFKKISPACIVGFHNIPEVDRKIVMIKAGVFSAAVKSLILEVSTTPSHAAHPESFTLMDVFTSLHQAIQQKTFDSDSAFFRYTPVYLTMGTPHYGIRPSQANYHLTMRASNDDLLEQQIALITEHFKELAITYKLQYSIREVEYFPPTINDNQLVRILEKTTLDNAYIPQHLSKPFYWGEDMGYYSRQIPVCFFGLGTGTYKPLHSPNYRFPEEVIADAIGLHVPFMKAIKNQFSHGSVGNMFQK